MFTHEKSAWISTQESEDLRNGRGDTAPLAKSENLNKEMVGDIRNVQTTAVQENV